MQKLLTFSRSRQKSVFYKKIILILNGCNLTENNNILIEFVCKNFSWFLQTVLIILSFMFIYIKGVICFQRLQSAREVRGPKNIV